MKVLKKTNKLERMEPKGWQLWKASFLIKKKDTSFFQEQEPRRCDCPKRSIFHLCSADTRCVPDGVQITQEEQILFIELHEESAKTH